MLNHKKAAAMVALAAAAAAVPIAVAGPAQAAEKIITGTVAAGLGLNVHSGSPTGTVIDIMPNGSTARLSCWVSGPSVTGPWGATSVWDAVEGYTTPSGQNIDFVGGTHVFSADAWINTGGDTSKMLPHC